MLETIEMLKQGGWPMIPLGICSFIAVIIIIERAIALRRNNVIEPRVLEVIEQYNGETSAEPAIISCQRARGAFAGIVEEVIKARHLDHAQAIESMHAVGRTHVSQLGRGLTALEIVAAISPLLGLLGTVVGMVTVFNAITAQGLGNPQVLADGISKALITTVAGLSIGIPALACHTLFTRHVDDLATQMQDRATNFIVKLNAFNGRNAQAAPPPENLFAEKGTQY